MGKPLEPFQPTPPPREDARAQTWRAATATLRANELALRAPVADDLTAVRRGRGSRHAALVWSGQHGLTAVHQGLQRRADVRKTGDPGERAGGRQRAHVQLA